MVQNLEHTSEFSTDEFLQSVKSRISEWITKEGGAIKEQSDSRLVAEFGSMMQSRILGVMLAGVKVVPREITITFETITNGTKVYIEHRETAGFGSRAGIKGKIERLIESEIYQIERLFAN